MRLQKQKNLSFDALKIFANKKKKKRKSIELIGYLPNFNAKNLLKKFAESDLEFFFFAIRRKNLITTRIWNILHIREFSFTILGNRSANAVTAMIIL